VLAERLPSVALRDVLLISAGVLVVAASAQIVIPLPFTPVPITGQTFGVLLVGGALGCWIVLYDPGTGLEGEVAELYVAEGHRREGIGRALLDAAIKLFEDRGVTLGYVWTRPENEAAVKLYQEVGFTPNRQLVLTWYPDNPSN